MSSFDDFVNISADENMQAAAAGEKGPKKHKPDLERSLAIALAKGYVSLEARARAKESCLFSTYIIPTDDFFCVGWFETTAETDARLKDLKKQKKKVIFTMPIHVRAFIGGVKKLHESAPPSQIRADFLRWADEKQNLNTLANELKYMRVFKCHDKSKAKVIVHMDTNAGGTPTSIFWQELTLQHFVKIGHKTVGMAPKAPHARKACRLLEKLGEFKRRWADIDDEEEEE